MTPFPARSFRLDRPGAMLRAPTFEETIALAAMLTGMDPWRRQGASEAALALYLDSRDPALHRYAVEADGALAGVLTLRWPWLRGPFIEILAIRPQMTRRGLGRATVDWAAGRATRVGGNLWTSTGDFNAPARAFWRAANFDEVALLPGLIVPGTDEILLRRRLQA